MDERVVHEMLDQVEAGLANNKREREALEALKENCRAILGARPAANSKDDSQKLTQRKAVAHVIREARGKPVTAVEVVERARELGVEINGKQPKGIVDLLVRDLMQRKDEGMHIERVGPQAYRWGVTAH